MKTVGHIYTHIYTHPKKPTNIVQINNQATNARSFHMATNNLTKHLSNPAATTITIHTILRQIVTANEQQNRKQIEE